MLGLTNHKKGQPTSLLQNNSVLFGRNEELASLQKSFATISEKSQIVVLSGPSGIGKSVLAEQLKEPVQNAGGSFVSGRFEQHQRSRPYRAFVTAFRELLQQFLAETPEQRQHRKAQIHRVLGQNAGLMIPLLPELKLLLDETPAFPKLEPEQARNIALNVFWNLIQELSHPEQPLVMFLDDLQWADQASLELLEFGIQSTPKQGLLILVSYRNNEVDESHPLTPFLQRLEASDWLGCKVCLEPLSLDVLTDLISTCGNVSNDVARPLAEILRVQTAGNPFFVRALLDRLHEDSLLQEQTGRWHWDLEAIQSLEVTDNVVALMMEELQRLPVTCLSVLQIASFLGFRFSGVILAEFLNHQKREIVVSLRPAVLKGLIVPESSSARALLSSDDFQLSYRFAHDKIQEALYSLYPDEERPNLHFEIAQFLIQQEDGPEKSGFLFDIVRHLESSHAIAKQREDRGFLATMFQLAAQKAIRSAAFKDAFQLAGLGIELLGQDAWTKEFSTSLALVSCKAESALLTQPYPIVEACSHQILSRGRSLVEQLPGWVTLMRAQIVHRKMDQALETGNRFLRQAGEPPPKFGHFPAILWGMVRTILRLWGRKPKDLISLPETTDSLNTGIMEVQILCSIPYVATQPEMVPVTILRDVRSVLRFGISGYGVQCWTGYGIIHCALGQIERGVEYGNLALIQVERLQRFDLWPRCAFFVYICIYPWKLPTQELTPFLEELVDRAIQVGDLGIEGPARLSLNYLLYFSGAKLDALKERLTSDWIDFVARTNRASYYNSVLQSVEELQKPFSPSKPFQIDRKSDHAPEPSILFIDNILELHLNLILGEDKVAFELAMQPNSFLETPLSISYKFEYYTFAMLALCKGLEHRFAPRRVINKQFKRYLRQLKKLVRFRPEERDFRLSWVKAAFQQSQGKLWKAEELFQETLLHLQESGVNPNKALVAEQLSSLYRTLGQTEQAQTYSLQAMLDYKKWGALCKVKQLSTMHPEYREKHNTKRTDERLSPRSQKRSLQLTGQKLGEWTLLKVVGSGGNATVYEAQHLTTQQNVALKLQWKKANEQEAAQQLVQEGQRLMNLSHPNILKVHDCFHEARHGTILVMELLQGVDLSHVINQDAPLPLRWLLPVIQQVCEGLECIHQSGLVHGDLKPANIFLDNSRNTLQVKLVDFGLAQEVEFDDSGETATFDELQGTPAYLAPEQLKEGTISPATDLYALAVLIFESLTGQLPHQGHTFAELALHIAKEAPIRLGTLRPDLKRSKLEKLLFHSLSKNTSERPQSPRNFWLSLEQASREVTDEMNAPQWQPRVER